VQFSTGQLNTGQANDQTIEQCLKAEEKTKASNGRGKSAAGSVTLVKGRAAGIRRATPEI
jgi:hypothetical protein